MLLLRCRLLLLLRLLPGLRILPPAPAACDHCACSGAGARVPADDLADDCAAGRPADAGRDAGRLADGSTRVDAGPLRWTQGSTGCTCRAGVAEHQPGWYFGALCLGTALAARRRRRSRR